MQTRISTLVVEAISLEPSVLVNICLHLQPLQNCSCVAIAIITLEPTLVYQSCEYSSSTPFGLSFGSFSAWAEHSSR